MITVQSAAATRRLTGTTNKAEINFYARKAIIENRKGNKEKAAQFWANARNLFIKSVI